jgi:hypothetical protein
MPQEKLTQHQLILKYIELHGSICPATLSDKDRRFMDGYFIGSQCDKRCRELRADKKLDSAKNDKGFEVFRLRRPTWDELRGQIEAQMAKRFLDSQMAKKRL